MKVYKISPSKNNYKIVKKKKPKTFCALELTKDKKHNKNSLFIILISDLLRKNSGSLASYQEHSLSPCPTPPA